jgi:protein kinase A
MLAGYPPFNDEDPMKTYGRIMAGNFSFPMHFSKQAMDLIRKLLNPKAGKRYGSLAGGATLIKNHPWFAKFDWHAFLARRLPAPIVLPVKSPEDLSNFDRGQEQTVKVVKYKPASEEHATSTRRWSHPRSRRTACGRNR